MTILFPFSDIYDTTRLPLVERRRKERKMKWIDRLEYFVGGVFSVPFVWLVASYADVLLHQFNGSPAFWNFFIVAPKLFQ